MTDRPPHSILADHLPLLRAALGVLDDGASARLFHRTVRSRLELREAYLDRLASLGLPLELAETQLEDLGLTN